MNLKIQFIALISINDNIIVFIIVVVVNFLFCVVL